MTPEEQKAAETKAAQEAEAAAQAAAAAQATEPGKEDVASIKAQLEKERAERRAANAEAQKFRKLVREQEELKKKAEEEALAQSGKFKELADAREKRAKELETELEQSRAKVTAYEQREQEEQARRATQVDADFAALPEDIRAEIPADTDLRTKEIAIRTYQKAAGKAVTPPSAPVKKPAPALPTPTVPRPAGAPASGLLTPAEEAKLAQTVGNPRSTPQQKAEARAKLAAHNAASRGR